MTPDWGEAPWGPPRPIESDALPSRCDVAIVGGGFTGLATALELARAGRDVVVLEATHIGAGASGRTGGLALEDTAVGPLEGVGNCIPHLRGVLSRESIECELSIPGCREVLHAAHVEGRAPAWRDGDAFIVTDTTVPGGTLNPVRLVEGLCQAARSAGARVCENARAVSVESGRVLLAGGANIEATHIVLGLNAYTRALRPEVDATPALTLAVCTEPAPGVLGDEPFYTIDLPYLWGRRMNEERLIFGAGIAASPNVDPGALDIKSPEATRLLDQLEARVRALHPSLAEVAITHRWGGPVMFRNDRLPLLCEPEPGVILTGAYAGHGVALSVRVGAVAAEAILNERPLPNWGRV